jgi:sigma-B regulation protein RsbU (phosphoserine phosphatase)
MPNARALIADDQPDILEALRLLLKGNGYDVSTARSPAALLDRLDEGPFDVLLMDLNYARDTTSGYEGLELLPRIRERDRDLPVVVMTAWTTVTLALATLREGVADFVEKPWDNARLLKTLDKQVAVVRESRRNAQRHAAAAAELARHERELAAAREIQARLLPARLPEIPGHRLAAAWQPARGVAGDHYDAFTLPDGRVAICLADVSGKGLPAALLAAQLQGTLHALSGEALAPDALCTGLNRSLVAQLSPEQFVAFVYGAFDAASGELTYANAGHTPPLLIRQDGTRVRLESGGPVLGQIADAEYRAGTVRLLPGDRLVMATDGVLEATAASGEELGEDRLCALVRRVSNYDLAGLAEIILKEATAFAGGTLHDDATVVVIAAGF